MVGQFEDLTLRANQGTWDQAIFFFQNMKTKIVIDDQAKAFLECKSPPIHVNELEECFSEDVVRSIRSAPDVVHHFIGSTSSGRTLEVGCRYVSWTSEIEILTAADQRNDTRTAKRDVSITDPAGQLDWAERYLVQALSCLSSIKSISPDSQEHISAERAFTNALGKANAFFCSALSDSSDPAMREHVSRRMQYLTDIEKEGRCTSCKK